MATATDNDGDAVMLECRNPNFVELELPETATAPPSLSEISLSTSEISAWDLSTILNHQVLKVTANRTRLIEQSSYFQSLLSGNFSESSMRCISIQWSLETFLHILRFMHGCPLEVTFCNFLPLYHAAVYFGLEKLILECKSWLYNSISKAELSARHLQLADLVRIWEFGLEHAVDWITGLCTSFAAKNFMWAMSCDTFVDLPYSFLFSCVKHTDLTVDSERHLCEALLAWVSANVELGDQTSNTADAWSDNSKQTRSITSDTANILKEIRVCLLPLWFTLGKCRCHYFSRIAKHGIAATLSLLKKSSKDSNYMLKANDWSFMKIRLTAFSKIPEITLPILLDNNGKKHCRKRKMAFFQALVSQLHNFCKAQEL